VSGVIDGRRRDGAAVIDCHSSSSSTTTRPDRHGVSLRVVCRTPAERCTSPTLQQSLQLDPC